MTKKVEALIQKTRRDLELSEEVEQEAKNIYNALPDLFDQNKNSASMASALTYIAAILKGEKKAQREIADSLGVSKVTLRTNYKKITDELEENVLREEKAETGYHSIKEEIEEKTC